MQELPAVSIYIITYLTSEERCEVLRETCRWALAQRYPNFEVVVSDNCGPVPAQEALAPIADPRLRVCPNEMNGGFVGNMNRCLRHCAHDIIKPLCDDDLIHPDFLRLAVPHVDRDTLVAADVEKFIFGAVPEAMGRCIEVEPRVAVRGPGYGTDIWRIPWSNSSIPSATLFTRTLFEQLGGYDAKTVTADWDFFVEVCLTGRIVHLEEKLCFVGVWPGSLTEEMVARPFFYPRELQYTQFRVLRNRTMGASQRRALQAILAREFVRQSLRPLKHPFRTAYWRGYADYARRFLQLATQPRGAFGR